MTWVRDDDTSIHTTVDQVRWQHLKDLAEHYGLTIREAVGEAVVDWCRTRQETADAARVLSETWRVDRRKTMLARHAKKRAET